MTCHPHQSAGRNAKLALVLMAILSLVTATAYSQTTESAPFDMSSPDQVMIEQDTKQILKRPEFRHLTQERPITSDSPFDLEDLLQEPAQKEASPSAPFIAGIAGFVILVLTYASIVCVCGLILYLLYRALTGFKQVKKIKDQSNRQELQGEIALDQMTSPAESEASTYLQNANALAQTGDYHHAIIQLLYGSMSFIERSGWIRFRKGLTYRDYLRAARPHGLAGDSFRLMIRTYEPLGFGRRKATREHFESTLSHYEAAFQKKA